MVSRGTHSGDTQPYGGDRAGDQNVKRGRRAFLAVAAGGLVGLAGCSGGGGEGSPTATVTPAPSPTGTPTPTPTATPTPTPTPRPLTEQDLFNQFARDLDREGIDVADHQIEQSSYFIAHMTTGTTVEAVAPEVDTIARLYADFVAAVSGPNPVLSGRVVRVEKPVAGRYTIQTEWALAYDRGELEEEAYLARVRETLEVE